MGQVYSLWIFPGFFHLQEFVPVGENGSHAMISGNDDSICRVLAKLSLQEALGKKRDETGKCCEDAYKEAERELLEMRFLRPFYAKNSFPFPSRGIALTPIHLAQLSLTGQAITTIKHSPRRKTHEIHGGVENYPR